MQISIEPSVIGLSTVQHLQMNDWLALCRLPFTPLSIMDPLLALSVAQNVITANSLLTYITGPLILSLPSIFHTRTTL